MMFYSSIYSFLCVLAVSAGITFVAAAETEITTDYLYGKLTSTAALPGFNVEGGSVFTNLANTINAGQLFLVATGTVVYERPESAPVQWSGLNWCSDLTLSDISNSSIMGYAGRCVSMILPGYDAMVAAGAQLTYDYSEELAFRTLGISAVFVEQLNVFEGQFHANNDNWVARYWDDGRKGMPTIAWKGHDEGDMSPNAATASYSYFGESTWMSVDEVAQLFNTSVDEFTPEKFKQIYLDTWIKDHEKEAADKNPNPLAELEIVEQVKNETNSADDTDTSSTTPVQLQPDSTAAEDVGSFVASAEITTDDLYAKIAPMAALPGFNVEGGSVFTNVAEVMSEGQLFFISTFTNVYEKPESEPVYFATLEWCSDLTFSDVNNSSTIGYAGRCVGMVLTGIDDMLAAGAQLTYDYSIEDFSYTFGISAVFAEQQNVFEGQTHADTDDWVFRYWDDGRKTMPVIGWKGHDEGDIRPNASTRSFSSFGGMTWSSVDEVAQLFNTSVDEFTPETFKQIYLDTWIKDHEKEAAEKNPNPLPELEIVEQVKNETNYADDTSSTTPVQPDSTAAEDAGSDGANPIVEDDSGSGRKLVSVAARFVLAALPVFGI